MRSVIQYDTVKVPDASVNVVVVGKPATLTAKILRRVWRFDRHRPCPRWTHNHLGSVQMFLLFYFYGFNIVSRKSLLASPHFT